MPRWASVLAWLRRPDRRITAISALQTRAPLELADSRFRKADGGSAGADQGEGETIGRISTILLCYA